MSNIHPATKIGVTLLFLILYGAFLWETVFLGVEYSNSGLALRLAMTDSQNFIFFPIAGLLVLAAFWRPTVMLADALIRGQLPFGRLSLVVSLVFCFVGAAALSYSFSGSSARSMFEIDPEILMADPGREATSDLPPRAPIADVLARMRILSSIDGGLSQFRSQCDPDWLKYSSAAREEQLCFPVGDNTSIATCCSAKADFRAHINMLAENHPSKLMTVHRFVLPFKCFFLLFLLALGILLVRYRKGLQRLHGGFENLSFGIAIGGAVMLTWPLLNASYLQTMALLTGSGSASSYTVIAPLITLGFGAWTLLLVFFHLRSYPSQVEYAAKIGGFIVAAIGVFRYEEITSYLARTLGIGGGLVQLVVFATLTITLLITIFFGVMPSELSKHVDEDGDP